MNQPYNFSGTWIETAFWVAATPLFVFFVFACWTIFSWRGNDLDDSRPWWHR